MATKKNEEIEQAEAEAYVEIPGDYVVIDGVLTLKRDAEKRLKANEQGITVVPSEREET